ncbi:cytochrome P450 [Trifolium medium]|uniref:Cytochrome P450 n=1 Tax=Trifolium medium TaxID=97028 RepID=A0A392M399_9FABA|nr:cytochrome P450 [Trifolium medium]
MDFKWDIEKFTVMNDFGLWKVKRQAILAQQKCKDALLGEANMSGHLTRSQKTEMIDKATCAIILCLGDKVMREVAKSLARRLFLKQQLYAFRMVESSSLAKSYENFKHAPLYGKEGTITLEEVQSMIKTKDLTKPKDKVDDNVMLECF